MYPRKEIASEASLAELLTIETLRRLENSEPCFLPNVDVPLASRIDPQDMDNAGGVAGVLAERADKILREKYGLGRSEIAEAVKWLWRLRIIFVGFVATSAAGICGHVLLAREAGQTVSVEGFVWFLVVSMLMAIPPVLLMLAALIGPGRASFLAEVLEDLGKALTVFNWVVVAAVSLIQKHLLPRAFPNAQSTERIERFGDAMGALVGGQSHLLLRAVAVTSHLCWTIVCSVVLVCFFASTTFRDYDFQWHSTWLDQAGKHQWLQIAAAPIRWLPPTPSPDENLVAYLSSDAPKNDAEILSIPLSTHIMDLARLTEESEGIIRASSNKIDFADLSDKGGEQRLEGIRAATEFLQRLNSLAAAIHDDPNTVQLVGHQGKETLYDLDKGLRELKVVAEKRKMKAEELLFAEATDGGATKLQVPAGRIYSDWHILEKLLTTINHNQQAAAREAHLRSRARASCVHLMAAFLLYYGLVPRLLLLVIARFQLARSLRALRPSVTSPYIAQIIANLKRPPMGPSPEPAPPISRLSVSTAFLPPPLAVRNATLPEQPHVPLPSAPDLDGPPSSPNHKPSEMDSTRTITAPPDPALAQPPAPLPSPSLLAVFGYEVEEPANGWDDVVPVSAFGEVVDLGNAADRESRNRAISELGRLAPELRFLTIVVDLIGSPDIQFVKFLRDAIAALPAGALSATVILLSGGEGLRAKFSGDAERIRTRVRLWREKIAECGVREDHIFEFDHRVATSHSRGELLGRFEAIQEQGAGTLLRRSSAVRVARRFSRASQLICAAARTVADCGNADRFGDETRKLHQKIHDLYQREATWLTRACAVIGHAPDSLPPLAAASEEQAIAAIDKLQEGATSLIDVGREKVEQAQQWWSQFRGYAGALGGRWAIAGGLAAALGGSLAGVPALATVWLLAAGAALGSQLPSFKQKLTCLISCTSDKGTRPAGAQLTASTVCPDDLVRTNVLWALVLELQGNSEELIAATLQRLLADCHAGLIGTASEAQELLDQVEERLRLLPATEPV